MAEVPELNETVSALTEYFVGDATVEETLLRVSRATAVAVPAAAYVGLTMIVDGSPATHVFTHPEVPEIDRAQYDTGDGPCLDAYRHGQVFEIRSTRSEARWSEFCELARTHGVLSTLSLPMVGARENVGAMNLYATEESAFSARASTSPGCSRCRPASCWPTPRRTGMRGRCRRTSRRRW
jgi:hypothetical protein